MKIAIVTQYYAPEPVPIAQSVAHGLRDRGHEVRVVTAFPNYPAGVLYDGYTQRGGHFEDDEGVRIHRARIFISHSNSAVGRVLNYLSFGFASFRAWAFVRESDVVYCYATQMTAAIGPDLWYRFRKMPYVMHVQDLWPESVTGSSMIGGQRIQKAVAALLRPWLRGLYRRAAATIGIGPAMSGILQERGVPADRIHSIYNWAQTGDLPLDQSRRLVGSHPGLRVMYAGNVGEMQDLETVIRAATLVTDLTSFSISIVGSGVAENRIREIVRKEGLSNVRFVGRVPFSKMAEHYAASDFQLVTLKNLDIFRATIPSKFQASLAIGIPVITTVAGDVANLVLEHDLGFASAPGDADALAGTFRTAYATSMEERNAMSQRARSYYSASMSRARGLDQIERLLAMAAKGATS